MEVVIVPMAKAADYWHQPWADVKGAAVMGVDGLKFEVRPTSPPPKGAPAGAHGAWVLVKDPDVAVLREGRTGNCWLAQQNWVNDPVAR
jgi:hypothetical protein